MNAATRTALAAEHARYAPLLADLDALLAHAQRIRARWQAQNPELFVAHGRREGDTDAPSADGLHTTDCTGVQTGNSDIPTPEYNPPASEAERPTLPGHEHQLATRSFR